MKHVHRPKVACRSQAVTLSYGTTPSPWLLGPWPQAPWLMGRQGGSWGSAFPGVSVLAQYSSPSPGQMLMHLEVPGQMLMHLHELESQAALKEPMRERGMSPGRSPGCAVWASGAPASLGSCPLPPGHHPSPPNAASVGLLVTTLTFHTLD